MQGLARVGVYDACPLVVGRTLGRVAKDADGNGEQVSSNRLHNLYPLRYVVKMGDVALNTLTL